MQNSESAKCSMCGRLRTSITDPESGELICGNCGMVITDKFQDITNPERLAYTIEQSD